MSTTGTDSGGGTGPRLIGGEMPAWSDSRPGERPPVRGPVLAHLLGLVRAQVPADGRVLLAGPHDSALVRALSGVSVTCLLRSQSDAAQVAERHGVQVLCGTLAKLTDTDRYDVVIALDGLDRLCSVEGPQLDWAESLQVLQRALRPGGTLLLAAENELGVHRLVERSAAVAASADGAWNPVGELDRSRPGSPNRLAARLAAEGLTVSWLGAAWPVPEAPTLVATPGALNTPDGPTGALVAAASGAVAAAYVGRPVLSDPRRIAATAVRGGVGAEFAASWLVLAHRAPGAANVPALPQVLLGDPVRGPVQELAYDRDGRWIRRVPGGVPAVVPADDAAALDAGADGRAAGAITRHPDRLAGPVPAGRLLEELLLTACLRHDLAAARRLLSGYVGWLGGLPTGHPFATFDNVLFDGATFALLDPSWDTTPPCPAPVSAVRALHRFAAVLLSGGYAHPWPACPDIDALTTVLAGAAGVELDAELLAAALALEVEVVAATGAPAGADRQALLQRVRDPGAPAATIGPDSWRQHAEANQRLRDQLAEVTARAEWFENEVIRRDLELRRARLLIAAFSGSPGYRLARVGLAVARRGARLIRRVQ